MSIGQQLVSEYLGDTLEIGQIRTTSTGRQVKIISGCVWSGGRLSNFFHWQEVMPNGELSSKDEGGYGKFDENGHLKDN